MTDYTRRRWLFIGVLVVALLASAIVMGAALTSIYGESDGEVLHENPSGPDVQTTDVDYEVNVPIRDGTVDFGHTQFTSPDGVYVEASEFDSDGLLLENVSAPARLFINGTARQDVALDGDYTTLDWEQVQLGSSDTELSADGSGSWGIDVSEKYVVYQPSSGGEQLLTADADGYHTVPLSGTTSATFVDTRDPVIDNLAPNDGAVISTSPVNISVDFSDPDAGIAGGTDEWTVTFYDAENDSVIGSETLTSTSQTANVSWDSLAGSGLWYATVEDAYGNTVQSEIREVSLPDQLEFRDEQTGELLDGQNITVTAELYGSDQSFEEQTVTNGILSLEGLNPDERFVVQANTSGYYQREILVRDITQRSRLYLLDKNATSVTNEFVINDNTGRFSGPGTAIQIRRPVQTDANTTEFRVVAGDVINVGGGYSTELKAGQRYRILVENDQGEQRDVGPYTADRDGVISVEVGSTQFRIDRTDTLSIDAAATKTDAGGELQFALLDPNNRTTGVAVKIYERGNATNVLREDTYFPSDGSRFGNLTVTELVNSKQIDKRWTIEYEIRSEDGDTQSGRVDVTGGQNTLPLPIPQGWAQILSVGAILLVGGLFSAQNAPLGAIIVPSIAGVLALIGMLDPVTGGASVAIALSIGVAYRFATGATP